MVCGNMLSADCRGLFHVFAVHTSVTCASGGDISRESKVTLMRFQVTGKRTASQGLWGMAVYLSFDLTSGIPV